MTQLHFTLEQDFFTGLFTKSREEAFGLLIQCLLNQFLQAESEEKLKVSAYERNEERTDYRNGYRERQVTTRIGRMTLVVPRHRNEPFHSSMLENYQRNETALITTMMEMVVQGVSTRKVEKITEELCGTKFSKSTVSELCKGLDEAVHAFNTRPLEGVYPFLIIDALYLKVREDYCVRSKGLMIALGINKDGRKEILGFEVCEGETEHYWGTFLRKLKARGLRGVDIVTSDDHSGLVAAVRKEMVGVGWQRCQFHFIRNILDKTPKRHQTSLCLELREMFNASTLEGAREAKKDIMKEYGELAEAAMETLDEGFEDATNIMCLPERYRVTLRTSNLLERENGELRRREKVIRVFPNVESVIRLMGAVLMDHHNDWSTLSRVFSMGEYFEERDEFLPELRKAA